MAQSTCNLAGLQEPQEELPVYQKGQHLKGTDQWLIERVKEEMASDLHLKPYRSAPFIECPPATVGITSAPTLATRLAAPFVNSLPHCMLIFNLPALQMHAFGEVMDSFGLDAAWLVRGARILIRAKLIQTAGVKQEDTPTAMTGAIQAGTAGSNVADTLFVIAAVMHLLSTTDSTA